MRKIEWKRRGKEDTSTLQFLILFHTIFSNSFIPNKIKMAEKKLKSKSKLLFRDFKLIKCFTSPNRDSFLECFR